VCVCVHISVLHVRINEVLLILNPTLNGRKCLSSLRGICNPRHGIQCLLGRWQGGLHSNSGRAKASAEN
jgi:hypothetical protein